MDSNALNVSIPALGLLEQEICLLAKGVEQKSASRPGLSFTKHGHL
jgi:hypothetical protein